MDSCSTHPSAAAAWTCSDCGKPLCPDCAAADEIRGMAIARCVHCGDVATLIKVPQTIQPYWAILPQLIVSVFKPMPLLTLGAMAVLMTFVRFLPLIGGLAATGIFAGYFFLTLRHAMGGTTGMPRPGDFHSVVDDVIFPGIRMILATAVLWAPTFAYAIWRMSAWSKLGDTPWLILADPGLITIIAVSVLYFPGALIVAAVNENLLSVLNPMNAIGIAMRIPGEYVATVVVVVILGSIDLGVTAGVSAAVGFLPIIGAIIVQWAGMFIPMVIALILGRLIFQNSVAFGLAMPDDDMVPAVPGARPMATLPEHLAKKEEPVAQRRDPFRDRVSRPAPEPIPLDPEPIPLVPETDPSPPHVPEPIPLEPEAPSPPAPGLAATPLPLTMTHTPQVPEPGDVDDTSMAEAMYDPGRETAAAAAAIQPRTEPAVTSAFDAAPDQPDAADPLGLVGNEPMDPSSELLAALKIGNQAASVELYSMLVADGVTLTLDAQNELRLATYLADAGRFTDAVFACRRAAQSDPSGPLAPGATFTAARLLFEKLGQRDQAAALLQYMIQNYPENPLTGRARDVLAKLGD